jgi:hypothetical protein
MLSLVLLTLAAAPDFSELKIEPRGYEYNAIGYVTEGLVRAPLTRYATKYDVTLLNGEDRAALTRQILQLAKTFITSPEGRQRWQQRLQTPGQTVADLSAGYASEFAYWTTLAKERKVKRPDDAANAERATRLLAAFKKERPRLEREELTSEKAAAKPDDEAFKAQLKERLTYFLAETKSIPFDAKLVEADGRRTFVDPQLEAKAKWWKFCFRAGPEATKAARDFATEWLAELNAPPSPAKLNDEK